VKVMKVLYAPTSIADALVSFGEAGLQVASVLGSEKTNARQAQTFLGVVKEEGDRLTSRRA